MGDLISRSKLLEEIQNWGGCVEALEEYIKKMPTAYDVEKVVAELNDYYEERLVIVTPQARERVEEIVRNGGKE